MNSKKIKLVFILVLCIGSLCSKAQSQWITQSSISLGPEVLFPMHSTSNGYQSDNYYRDGGGFSAMFELPLINQLKFTFSAGYQFYIPTSKVYISQVYYTCAGCTVPPIPGQGPSAKAYQFIPITAGLRYYFVKYLFLAVDGGKAISAGGGTITSYIYGGGLGAYLPFGHVDGLDLATGIDKGFKSLDFDYSVSQFYIKVAYKHRF